MKKIGLRIFCVFMVSLSFSGLVFAQTPVELKEEHFFNQPFNQTENTALEAYFSTVGLDVVKPIWQKKELLNVDNRVLYNNREFSFEVKSQGLIMSFDAATDDEMVIELNTPSGKKYVYHQVREVVLKNIAEGVYTVKLQKSLSGAVNFNVFSANYILPNNEVIAVTNEMASYPLFKENLLRAITNGSVVINIGSGEIDDWVKESFGNKEEIALAGEEQSMQKIGESYFYVPVELFLTDEKAQRVAGILADNIVESDYAWQNNIGVVVIFLIVGLILFGWYLLFEKRNTIKKIPLLSWLRGRNLLINIAVTTIIGIVGLAILLYLYQNYSGLDLFPNFSISSFMQKWQLQIWAGILLGASIIVLLVSQLVAQTIFLAMFLATTLVVGALVYLNFDTQAVKHFTVVKGEISIAADDFEGEKLTIRSRHPLKVRDKYQSEVIEVLEEFLPSKEEIALSFANKSNAVRSFYSQVENNSYYIQKGEGEKNSENNLKVQLVLRSNNAEFGNKSFYLNLLNTEGATIGTQFFSLPEVVIGEDSKTYSYDFEFENTTPDIYTLNVANVNANTKGDYELVSIGINNGAGNAIIISINEAISNIKEFSFEFIKDTDLLLGLLQNDQLLDLKFTTL